MYLKGVLTLFSVSYELCDLFYMHILFKPTQWILLVIIIVGEPGLLEGSGAEAGASKKNYRIGFQEPVAGPFLREPEPVKTPKNGSQEQGARSR